MDTLITHPNVMNGAALYAPQDNILYTEGYALDEFAAGKWGTSSSFLLPQTLRLPHPPTHPPTQLIHPPTHLSPQKGLAPFLPGRGGHRIGLVLDKAMEEDMRLRHLQVADGMRATLGKNLPLPSHPPTVLPISDPPTNPLRHPIHPPTHQQPTHQPTHPPTHPPYKTGLNIAGYTVTDEPLGVGIALSPGGASWGRVKRPGTLLRAARKLVEEGGCTALAIVGTSYALLEYNHPPTSSSTYLFIHPSTSSSIYPPIHLLTRQPVHLLSLNPPTHPSTHPSTHPLLPPTGRFPDDEDQEMLQAYREGHGVDCVGGAEAIISHLVTSELKVTQHSTHPPTHPLIHHYIQGTHLPHLPNHPPTHPPTQK